MRLFLSFLPVLGCAGAMMVGGIRRARHRNKAPFAPSTTEPEEVGTSLSAGVGSDPAILER